MAVIAACADQYGGFSNLDELRAAVCRELGVGPGHLLVGNGSDELIYLLVIAFAAMGGRTVCADPAYRMHDIVPKVLGCQVTRVPLRDWVHDLEAMAGVQADLAFVCNPHNPSGTAVSHGRIARFAALSKAGLIVVDEAYIDFADDPQGTSALDLVGLGNVVVLRTFSKLFGLAEHRWVSAGAAIEGINQQIDVDRLIIDDKNIRAVCHTAYLMIHQDLTEVESRKGHHHLHGFGP